MEEWSSEKIDLLQGFVKETLSASAMSEAQSRYASDPGFKAEVEEMRKLIRITEEMEKAEIRSAIAGVGQEAFSASSGIRSPKIWLPLAASLLLLAVVGYFTLRSSFEVRAFNTAFTPLASNETFLGTPEKDAYQLYEDKNYSAAIAAYDTMTIENDTAAYQKSRLFKGIALLADGQFTIAEDLFAKHLASPAISMASFDYYEDEQWYYALALLRNGKADACKAILVDLVDSRVERIAEQARSLLQRLE